MYFDEVFAISLFTFESVALGRHARRRLVAAGACDISDMVYRLNHEIHPVYSYRPRQKIT